MPTVRVTVRDSRPSRDASKVDEEGRGPVLGTATMTEPPNIGDVIALPDGTRVVVIGSEELLGETWECTVHVDSLPEPPTGAVTVEAHLDDKATAEVTTPFPQPVWEGQMERWNCPNCTFSLAAPDGSNPSASMHLCEGRDGAMVHWKRT